MLILILMLTALSDQRSDGDKPPAVEDERAFEGTWELVSRYHGLERQASEKRQIVVKEGIWREGPNGRFMTVKRSAARPWPRIELGWGLAYRPPHRGMMSGSGMGGGLRGIYHLEGDTLTIVIGPWKGPLPDGLTPAPGRDVEVWHRVRR